MNSPEEIAFSWTAKLIAFAVVLQTIELISLQSAYSDRGVWRWKTLQSEFDVFSEPVKNLLSLFLKYPNFLAVLYLRLASALLISIFPHPIYFALLFLTTLLALMRFRGTFNGGSDYMSLVIISALTVASIFSHKQTVMLGCLWYIAIQSCLSYFIAGIVKLRKSSWRTGKALPAFVNSSNYKQPKWLLSIFNAALFSLIFSWAAMLAECFFPLVFLNPSICLAFMAAAFIFHLANFYIFGLNRFIFAWLASYPALYYASGGFNI